MTVKFERDVVHILCKEHNIRTERCDCEHRAVLAGQQLGLKSGLKFGFKLIVKDQ